MKPVTFGAGAALLALVVSGQGCGYRGALYASYQEAGLGIKASAESNSPIKVHFGYDRGVGAWVPRRGGSDEEATSLISRDDVKAGVNPTKMNEPLLQTDGVVISGTAAIVASAPTNATVRVTESDASVLELQTRGTPGQRIATALTSVALSAQQLDQVDLINRVAGEKNADAVFSAAAKKMSNRFQTLFRQNIASHDPVPRAFRRATFLYQNEVDDSRTRVAETVAALQAAQRE